MMFALSSSVNHTPIKYRGPVKKTSHIRPIYLSQSLYYYKFVWLVLLSSRELLLQVVKIYLPYCCFYGTIEYEWNQRTKPTYDDLSKNVGLTHLVVLVLQLLQVDLRSNTCVALAYLKQSSSQIQMEHRTSHDALTVIGSACLPSS